MKESPNSEEKGDDCFIESTYKPFQIIKPPVLISKICEVSKDNFLRKCKEEPDYHLEQLLDKKRDSNIKRINKNRETYRGIK